ncbi:diguanylate cyclase [Bosea sp. (in: a-proteobacteria)]|uniref:GGDEF domain-containing response regulator n=1 Tax=Bosea sp. (in: a-proteobacteria) TaxID=1871050 RepID=UPI003B3AEB41
MDSAPLLAADIRSPAAPAGILVIEDSRTFATALRQFLEADTGLPVTTCSCLKDLDALIAANPAGFAVAVVDLNLPDAPRGEALDWTVSHAIPSIVFTATFDLATRERIMEREVVDYVLKDNELALPNLVATVKRALDNRSRRILVVDDMRTTRKVLARMLSIQQYVVVEAGSGVEALQLLATQPDIELVVSDYHMPDMDGYELARRIRRDHPEVRIIGVSSSTDRQTSAGFLKAGAHDFLARPFVLEELQCRIASNVETLGRVRQLKDLAARDYLTGLYNRRHFFEHGRQLLEDARKGRRPCSIALLDVDHFKRLNDNYGHEGGDKALSGVAQILERVLGTSGNLLARMGGEEFAILLPGSDSTRTFDIAEAVRLAIESEPVRVGAEILPMTVSIGVAPIDRDETLESALNLADRALYGAKQNGRNQVCADID